MFTGLVLGRGRVVAVEPAGDRGGRVLAITHQGVLRHGDAGRPALGASIAIDGCCLTVVEGSGSPDDDAETVVFELSAETLRRTTLGSFEAGREVNLEPALRLGDPVGGHLVQGHVDATCELLARRDEDEFSTFRWSVPPSLARFLVEKGSIAVDGVSLTVATLDTDDGTFEAALVPHTLEVTTLGAKRNGDRFNLEVDVLGKYVARMLDQRFG